MKKRIPAVSIVIPLYNAEKYVGECLDSILAQTFKDFEVIVVDDCSTDKSCDVVESYLPKFNQRGTEKLKLLRRSFNSGNPGMPSNDGIKVSRGEYILFIDNDDEITPTALEDLYPIAKKFDADVVHCEKYFEFIDGQDTFKLSSYQTGEFVNEPTLLTDDLAQRTVELNSQRFILNLWTKLIRRDYVLFNNLELISGMAQDALFTICLMLSAKNYVRVPHVINLYRIHDRSISHKSINVATEVSRWLKGLSKGFVYFDKFLSEREFFQKHPDVKYLALDTWVKECCQYFLAIYEKIPPFQLDEIIRQEFSKVHDKTGLMAFLFSRMNVLSVNLIQREQMIQQLQQTKS